MTRTPRPTDRSGPSSGVGVLVAVVAAGALALTGCADEGASAAPPAPTVAFTAGEAPVVVPGSPGQASTTVAPGAAGEIANADAWNEHDVEFVVSMVPHHTQALRMAGLAPERASDPRVRAVAERILSVQAGEVEQLQTWLTSHGMPEADPQDMDHDGMQGMAGEPELLALTSAQGEEFDRLFLELMSEHHRGALAMADDAVGAANPQVLDMVSETVAGQSVEIDRMQVVLTDLS